MRIGQHPLVERGWPDPPGQSARLPPQVPLPPMNTARRHSWAEENAQNCRPGGSPNWRTHQVSARAPVLHVAAAPNAAVASTISAQALTSLVMIGSVAASRAHCGAECFPSRRP